MTEVTPCLLSYLIFSKRVSETLSHLEHFIVNVPKNLRAWQETILMLFQPGMLYSKCPQEILT